MKLSGLKCPFSLRPQSTMNVPVVAPFCCFGFLTFGFTLVMSTKSFLSAPSASAAPSEELMATTAAPPATSAIAAAAAVSQIVDFLR